MSLQQFDEAAGEGALVQVVTSTSALEAQVRGEIDIQINTAKKFGRDIGRSLKNAVQLATMSEEVAKTCWYTVPRGRDGNVEGKSIRLAEIAAQAWGNMRIAAVVVGMDDEFVTVQGSAFDLESNVAFSQPVRRRIVDKSGKRYSTDVLTSTTNAAISIALRNAIFRVIPGPFTDTVYAAARKVAVGDVQTFPARRDKAIAAFLKLGIREDQILSALGVVDRQGITGDHYLQLEGFMNAIKQDGVSIESIFAAPAASAEASAPVRGTDAVKEKLKAAKAPEKPAEAAPAPTEPEPSPMQQWSRAWQATGLSSHGVNQTQAITAILGKKIGADYAPSDAEFRKCLDGLPAFIESLGRDETEEERVEREEERVEREADDAGAAATGTLEMDDAQAGEADGFD